MKWMALILACCVQSAAQQPRAFETNHRLAESYRIQGNLEAAIPLFEKAYEADPENYPNAWDLAVCYLQTGSTIKARNLLNAMLKRGVKAELHNLLGAVEERSGNLPAAFLEYQRAAQMDPSEKNIFDEASCISRYGAYAQARDVFLYGIQKYPKSARMRVGLAIAFHGLKEYRAAVDSLCKAVDLDPGDTRALYFLVKLHDVSPELSGEVTERLARLVRLHPDNALANYGYAVGLWKQHRETPDPSRIAEAERYLLKAIQLDAGIADAHFQLGALYREQKDLPAAIRELDTAVRLTPDSPLYRFRLAQAYRDAGDERKAHEQFEVFRKLKARERSDPDAAR
jgi:tetratricopeptide (TPR) repeat protein